MILTAATTGSLSLRLTWDPTLRSSSSFTVYRGPDAIFAHATAISSALGVGAPWYNDYTVSPGTTYYYWIVDQNNFSVGPTSATTLAASLNQEALDEAQLTALQNWAYSIWNGLYPAYYRYQPVPQLLKPKIILNPLSLEEESWSYDMLNMNEAIGSQIWGMLSVNVSSDPQPPVRGLLNIVSLGAGTYTITINSVPYSVTYAVPPTSATQVISDLQALLAPASGPLFTTLQYGLDPLNQGLIIENLDTLVAIAATVTANLSFSTYTPPKAMTIAQRLMASLQDPNVIGTLYQAGISLGIRSAIKDVSAMLDTRAELVAQFDVWIYLYEIYPIKPVIIDTVDPLTGLYTN